MSTNSINSNSADNSQDSGSSSGQSQQSGMGPDIRKVVGPKRTPPYIIIGVVVTLILISFTGWMAVDSYQSRGKEVALSEIVREVSEGDYKKISIKDTYVVIESEDGGRKHALIDGKTNLYEVLADSGVQTKDLENDFYAPDLSISISDVITIILLGSGLVLVYMMIRSMQASGGKLMDFGQSKARLIFGKRTGISFGDVAGINDVKEELVEVVDFLKNPKKYQALGARIPKGVLLVGSPGTGKTLLAKAVAGEAGVPFFHTSGSEFEEMLVGAGASRVRDLFKKAKRAAPCIIFIDEIDAVAKKRGTVLHSGNGEQTLNQILVEMDGLEERENVIILAATNRPDVLDPAILRPGRFDRSVTVHMPDKTGRLEILTVHAKNKKFAADVDLDKLAKKTIGYSGADLENLLNEAAIMAAGQGKKEIENNHILESYLKVRLGRQKKNVNVDIDIERIAYHEAGHAVVSKFTKDSDPVEKVSIISRGSSGGVTVYMPEDERSLLTKSKLLSKISASVGGKIAEEVFLGEMTTGASSDIVQATDIARSMVQRYGMSEKLGFVKYGNAEESSFLGYQYGGDKEYSENTAQMIDEEVKRLIDEAQQSAKKILESNREKVEKLVKLLLDNEEVDREEFDALFA